MISNKRTKNRRIIARHNDDPEKKEYIPDPNFPYSICKTCAFLYKPNQCMQIQMCVSLADQGKPRDRNATNEHCDTYKPKKREVKPW